MDCTECWKRLKTEQILDKLSSFRSHATTKICTLISAYYVFYRRPDTLDYIAKLLKKDKFFYNNIENMDNQSHYHKSFAYRLTNYI